MISNLEKELIIAHILKKSREFVIAHPEIKLNSSQKKRFDEMLTRRSQRKPLAYVLKQKEFFGLNFYVDKRVLIPRPETEIMVEKVLEELRGNGAWKMEHECTLIDIGTGSGCIVIAIAKNVGAARRGELPLQGNINFVATDISKDALNVAKKNAKSHNLEKNIKFFQSDLLSPFIKGDKGGFETKKKNPSNSPLKRGGYVVITANLPYLSEKIYNSTPASVKDYEPKTALLSGDDGLDHYRKLFKQVLTIREIHPKLRISLFLEISPEQKNILERETKQFFPAAEPVVDKDLAGKWRVVKIDL